MNDKYTDCYDSTKFHYIIQQIYVDMLIDIFGEEKIKEIERHHNAYTLIEELSNIAGSKEDAQKLLMLMDDELNCYSNDLEISSDTSVEIQQMLCTYFLENEQKKLLESNEENYKFNYICYLDNTYEFKSNLNKEITMINILYGNNELITELSNNTKWYDKKVDEYSKPFLNQYEIDLEEINDLNEWINVDKTTDEINVENNNFIRTSIIDESYIITNSIDNELVRNNDTTTYTYNIFIKKGYLLYGEKEEILKYISEDKLNLVLEKISPTQKQL
jgi:hypothetical protein